MVLNEFENAQLQYEKVQKKEKINKNFIKDFCNELLQNEEDINKIQNIDKKYSTFSESIKSILKRIDKQKAYNPQIIEHKRKDEFIVGEYEDSIGVIGLISDGNPYVTIEVLIKAISTQNAMIICTNNSMYATNKYIIICMQKTIQKYGYPTDLIQIINSENYNEMYKHNNILKKIFVVGNKNLQDKVISLSKISTITSGYNCFDIYIEEIMDEKLIKNIIEMEDIELNIYINSSISKEKVEELGNIQYTEVENVQECIRDININSARYSSSIFTSNGQNANEFLKLVKSKNVFINASPTLERKLDFDMKDFTYNKKVMYINK